MSDVFATGWRTNAVRSREVKTVRQNGREYLQFPLIPLTEMVLNYPARGTDEYLPAKHIRETADLWDGTLLTYVHPSNRNQTVKEPDAFMGEVIGGFFDPAPIDNGEKLRGNGIIDVEKAEDLGGSAAELVELLRSGEQVSVSAGYATMEDEHRPGQFDGEQYDLVQGPPLPDHIAVFPSSGRMQARCSPEDGCAAPKANAYESTANQRANHEHDTTMNGSVFPSREEREKAIETIQREAPSKPGSEIRDVPNDDLLTIAQGFGYRLPDCNCSGTCDCQRSNARGRSESHPNMAAVPGKVNRDNDDTGRHQQRDDPEEFPAGGRKSWERRKVGLDETPEDAELPAGGRSAWEERKKRQRTNAHGTSDDDSGQATGSRSSYERRQNASDGADEQEWRSHEYPLTAKRRQEEREKLQKRLERKREQAKRNDARAKRRQQE